MANKTEDMSFFQEMDDRINTILVQANTGIVGRTDDRRVALVKIRSAAGEMRERLRQANEEQGIFVGKQAFSQVLKITFLLSGCTLLIGYLIYIWYEKFGETINL